MIRRTLIASTVAALLLSPSVHAQFTNGSFENSSTGWTLVDEPVPFSAMAVVGAGLTPWVGHFLTAPTDGSFVLQHGFDGGTPQNILAWQEVNVSGSMLEFDWRGAADLTFGATIDREFVVNIRPVGGGAALQSDLIATFTAGTTVNDTGAMTAMVDVSAFSGQMVRVEFEWVIPEPFTGPGHFQLDRVGFTGASGPTLSVIGNCGSIGSGLGVSGATGNGLVGFAWSVSTGNFVIGGAACVGTTIGIVNPNAIAVVSADAMGNAAVLPGNGIPAQGCGVVNCQALDISTCTPTNVLAL